MKNLLKFLDLTALLVTGYIVGATANDVYEGNGEFMKLCFSLALLLITLRRTLE